MTELEELDAVFNCDKKWKDEYQIFWCELCDTFSIKCKDKTCSGSSCNAGGCDNCGEAFDDFHKAKTSITEYLNDEEKKVYEKIWWIKKYMKESLHESEYEINWKRMKQQGNLCGYSEKIFEKEIKESFDKQPDAKFGDY